jgi:hypothetical protein
MSLPKAWLLWASTHWNKVIVRSRAAVKKERLWKGKVVERKELLQELTVHTMEETSAKTFM